MAVRLTAAAALRSQRRFLIVMSIAVAAYYYLQVHLKGEGEYSGLAVRVVRTDRIQIALWIIFAWALLRYGQRLHEGWRRVRREVMSQFEYYDHQLVLIAARRSAARQARAGRIGKDLEPPRTVFGEAEVTDTVKQMAAEMVRQRRAQQGLSPPEPVVEPWFVVDGGKRIYRGFAIRITGKDNVPSTMGYDFMMPAWGWWRVRVHQLHAWWRTAWRMPAIFEHLAPLVIAAGAIAVAIVYRLPTTQCV
jgi:hypothetical protein